MSLSVLSLSQLYPGVATPTEGVFVHQRLSSLPPEIDVRVWRLPPWFPFLRPRRGPPTETVGALSVESVPFLYAPGLFKGRDGHCLWRALRERSPGDADVIDAHFAFPVGWAAVRFARAHDLPVVITLRGTEPRYAADPARRARILEAVRSADRLIAVSTSLADFAVELGADPTRITVVGNGVDAERFHPGDPAPARQRLGIDSDAKVLLTVGGLTERKGVARVLEIMPRLLDTNPSLVYVVAGGGGPEGDETARLHAMTRKMGLTKHVRFLGNVAHADLPDVYRAADAFVLATRNEGWANALQESVATGLPTVATDVGGNREVLHDGAAGQVVPFGDAAALTDATLHALSGAIDRDAVAAIGQARSWTRVGRETADVLLDAAGRTAEVHP